MLVLRNPWPSIARTVYRDHKRYLETYMKPYPGFFYTGDGAARDKDGYIWIKGRVDDVINVSGHRLSTAEIESALILHAGVAETAAIVPFSRREHYCVGDAIPFQLEGTPPWTVTYRAGGGARTHTAEAALSPWSVPQHAPGEFAITSVAHQQKMCKTAVTDLRYTVHALPAAQVGHGKRIVQDIHEGDQAEIVFTLIGEPPFTFTYQRAELSPRKGVQGKVLETHTVSGVTTKEYSIFSALEGAWHVLRAMSG